MVVFLPPIADFPTPMVDFPTPIVGRLSSNIRAAFGQLSGNFQTQFRHYPPICHYPQLFRDNFTTICHYLPLSATIRNYFATMRNYLQLFRSYCRKRGLVATRVGFEDPSGRLLCGNLFLSLSVRMFLRKSLTNGQQNNPRGRREALPPSGLLLSIC